MASPFYPFAESADRLIQVAIKPGGQVQINVRTKTHGAWPGSLNPPAPFFPPIDPGKPVQVTLAVDPTSWGTASIIPPEWDDYFMPVVNILGQSGPNADAFSKSELDYGGGNQEPHPKYFTRALRFTTEGNLMTYVDPKAKPRYFQGSVDISQWYAQHAGEERACLVLRVSGNNHGTVTLENVDNGGLAAYRI